MNEGQITYKKKQEMNFPTQNYLDTVGYTYPGVNKYCFGGHLGLWVKYGLNYLKDPINELLDTKSHTKT